MRHLLVDLVRPAAPLFASDAKAGVEGDPVKPGRKGAVPLKPFMFAQTLTQTSWLASSASWPPSMRSVTPRTRAEWARTSFENASTSPRVAREISARSSALIGGFPLPKPSAGSEDDQDAGRSR